MSADNWMKCPKCIKCAEKSEMETMEKLGVSYGKIPEEQYLLLRNKLLGESEQVKDLDETFREDYELGTDEDGNFEISYLGQCTNDKCRFRFEYKYSEQVLKKENEVKDRAKSK